MRSPGSEWWRPVYSGAAPNNSVYGIGLSTPGDQFAHQDGSVAFDNFQLSSGELSCPDWWQDFLPDVWSPRSAGDDH